MKQDVVTHKGLFQNSEQKREGLQVHIVETSVTIKKDTTSHSSYQDTIITENGKLNDEI